MNHSDVMNVNGYLNENSNNFDVDFLVKTFDVQNMGDLLDPNETIDYLQSIERTLQKTVPVANVKEEPIQHEVHIPSLYFIDLTTESDTESRMKSIEASILANGRKQKQKSKPKRSPEPASAKRQPKKRTTKKFNPLILMSHKRNAISISE